MIREHEKNKPVYKLMRKVVRWYEDHKITPVEIGQKINILHDIANAEVAKVNNRQSKEVMALFEKIQTLKKEIHELSPKHRQEKEDMTAWFAQIELDLLAGKITEIPEAGNGIDSRPSQWWYFVRWFAGLADFFIVPPQKLFRYLSTDKVVSQENE